MLYINIPIYILLVLEFLYHLWIQR